MSSDKAQKLYEDAMQAKLSGDTARAADLLKQVVESDPERVDAWVELSKLLSDYDERRMALTTVLNLDPDNAYAQHALESGEKPKTSIEDNGEVVPGITRKLARTVGIGLVAYTLLVCGVSFLIILGIRGSKAAEADKVSAQASQIALLQVNQTETQFALTASVIQATDIVLTQDEIARATVLADNSPTPPPTNTRSFELPPENTPTVAPTEVSYRILDLPPALSGHVLGWGGKDVRSDDYLPLRSYDMSAPGTPFELINRELGRNPLMSKDGTVTAFEQWRSDGSRLYMNILDPVTPGGALDALVSNRFLVSALRDPSISDDKKRVAFIATNYTTQLEGVYLADLSDLAFPKFYQLGQDTATYSGVTISPDGTKAVAVRNDGTSTDLVTFDLTTIAAASNVPVNQPPLATAVDGAPTMPPPPTVAPPTIPIRPLTTDGNSLVEANPAFSPDGTRVVYEAYSNSTPNNHDLYTVEVGTTTSAATPIMTLDGNDVNPSFSPDGNYVVFGSDRQTGIYNIYIYDTASRTTYQLTADGNPVYPGSWSNN